MVVEKTGKVEPVIGSGPVAEHDRHCREHLQVNAVAVAVGQAYLRVPAVSLDLAEDLAVVPQHSRLAVRMMLDLDKPVIAILLFEARKVFGQNVGMDVYSHLSALVPQLPQVDRAGSP